MRLIAHIALGAALIAPILAAPVMRAEPASHWHAGDNHGWHKDGAGVRSLSRDDCEALFGGSGWDD